MNILKRKKIQANPYWDVLSAEDLARYDDALDCAQISIRERAKHEGYMAFRKTRFGKVAYTIYKAKEGLTNLEVREIDEFCRTVEEKYAKKYEERAIELMPSREAFQGSASPSLTTERDIDERTRGITIATTPIE